MLQFDFSFHSAVSTYRITDKIVGTMTGYTLDQITETTNGLAYALAGLILFMVLFARLPRFRKLVSHGVTGLLVVCCMAITYELGRKLVHFAQLEAHMWHLRKEKLRMRDTIADLQNQVERYLDM